MPTSGSVSRSTASKAFLVVAIALGVLATILAFGFINSAGGGSGPKTQIVIARRDLPVTTRWILRATWTSGKSRPLSNRSTSSPSMGAALTNYKGQRINRNIPAGQPVFLADLGNVADYRPTPGLVALPDLAEPGIAIPGDYVKVLVARPDTAAPLRQGWTLRSPYVASYAARGQAFRIIAVGGNLFRTRSQILAADAASASSSSKLVTLEVTEAQAQEIQSALGGMQRATLVIVAPPAGAESRP